MKIVWLQRINNLDIYRRERNGERIPLYVVFAPDGRTLEEFRRLNSAIRWCYQTKDFVGAA